MEIPTLAFVLAFQLPLEAGVGHVLAYLDAGTGSLIFQVLVASLVSAGVVFGGVMSQLRSFFSRVMLRRSPDSAAPISLSSAEQSVIDSPSGQNDDGRLKALTPSEQRKAA